jgi:hypothetical protein
MSHVIRVDDEVYDVIKAHQVRCAEYGRRVSMSEAVKERLYHRQPGGWGQIVAQARRHLAEREISLL